MALEPDLQRIVDDVAKYGWHVVTVSSAVAESEKLPFAYTVGLNATFGWPELLCYGLASDIMAELLNNAVDELRRLAGQPQAGLLLGDVAAGFECRLSPVAKKYHADHLGFALRYARYRHVDDQDVECLQLLWPDQVGRFPDEAGCSEGVKDLQRILAS